MGARQFEKGSREWCAFRDYYKFRQDFYFVDKEDPDTFWEACLRRANEIYMTYRSRYVLDLLTAHVNDLIRRESG